MAQEISQISYKVPLGYELIPLYRQLFVHNNLYDLYCRLVREYLDRIIDNPKVRAVYYQLLIADPEGIPLLAEFQRLFGLVYLVPIPWAVAPRFGRRFPFKQAVKQGIEQVAISMGRFIVDNNDAKLYAEYVVSQNYVSKLQDIKQKLLEQAKVILNLTGRIGQVETEQLEQEAARHVEIFELGKIPDSVRGSITEFGKIYKLSKAVFEWYKKILDVVFRLSALQIAVKVEKGFENFEQFSKYILYFQIWYDKVSSQSYVESWKQVFDVLQPLGFYEWIEKAGGPVMNEFLKIVSTFAEELLGKKIVLMASPDIVKTHAIALLEQLNKLQETGEKGEKRDAIYRGDKLPEYKGMKVKMILWSEFAGPNKVLPKFSAYLSTIHSSRVAKLKTVRGAKVDMAGVNLELDRLGVAKQWRDTYIYEPYDKEYINIANFLNDIFMDKITPYSRGVAWVVRAVRSMLEFIEYIDVALQEQTNKEIVNALETLKELIITANKGLDVRADSIEPLDVEYRKALFSIMYYIAIQGYALFEDLEGLVGMVKRIQDFGEKRIDMDNSFVSLLMSKIDELDKYLKVIRTLDERQLSEFYTKFVAFVNYGAYMIEKLFGFVEGIEVPDESDIYSVFSSLVDEEDEFLDVPDPSAGQEPTWSAKATSDEALLILKPVFEQNSMLAGATLSLLNYHPVFSWIVYQILENVVRAVELVDIANRDRFYDMYRYVLMYVIGNNVPELQKRSVFVKPLVKTESVVSLIYKKPIYEQVGTGVYFEIGDTGDEAVEDKYFIVITELSHYYVDRLREATDAILIKVDAGTHLLGSDKPTELIKTLYMYHEPLSTLLTLWLNGYTFRNMLVVTQVLERKMLIAAVNKFKVIDEMLYSQFLPKVVYNHTVYSPIERGRIAVGDAIKKSVQYLLDYINTMLNECIRKEGRASFEVLKKCLDDVSESLVAIVKDPKRMEEFLKTIMKDIEPKFIRVSAPVETFVENAYDLLGRTDEVKHVVAKHLETVLKNQNYLKSVKEPPTDVQRAAYDFAALWQRTHTYMRAPIAKKVKYTRVP